MLVANSAAWSQQASTSQVEGQNADQMEFMRKSVAVYHIYPGPERIKELELRPEPILRWANPVRDVVDAASFLWVLDGRAQAVACVYVCRVNEVQLVFHEFQSLATSPLIAERDGQVAWEPPPTEVERKPVPAAPVPADEAPFRLTQMRALAREFGASIMAPESPSSLRLLPQPLYPYESQQFEVLDGGLFVFAQGTDPEVILILESRRTGPAYVWHYRIARMCAWALQVEHKGQSIWSVPTVRQHDRKHAYFMFRDTTGD